MKKVLFIAMIIMVMVAGIGCDSSLEQNDANISASFELSLKDIRGNDLLDNNQPNSIDIEEIKVFYELEGIKKEMREDHFHLRKYYTVYRTLSGDHNIRIFLNHSEKEDTPTTYVQWSEEDTDKLEGQFRYHSGNVILNKMWINNKLVWEGSSGKPAKFEIIK